MDSLEDAHGDMYQLDKVANEAHDGKADSDGFADLDELCAKRSCVSSENRCACAGSAPFCDGFVHRARNWMESRGMSERVTRERPAGAPASCPGDRERLRTWLPSWMNSRGISTNSLIFSAMVETARTGVGANEGMGSRSVERRVQGKRRVVIMA